MTLASVCAVKFAYEKIAATEHFATFQSWLKHELGDLNQLIKRCNAVGIQDILHRPEYQQQYGLRQIVSDAEPNTVFRIIGNTLFHVFAQHAHISDALEKGLIVQCCILDPNRCTETFEYLTNTYLSDIQSSLQSIKLIAQALPVGKPKGSLEIRMDDLLLFDSFVSFGGLRDHAPKVVAWDWSFGRDLNDKHVLIVDPAKKLGTQLAGRYEKIWAVSTVKFIYKDGDVSVNILPGSPPLPLSPQQSSSGQQH